jgi:hypothetical protein
MTTLSLQFATAPDREKEVAEIWFGDELVAELNQESGTLALEIYPKRDQQPWKLGVNKSFHGSRSSA